MLAHYKIAYPEAKMIGVEPLIEKIKEEVWKFDGGKCLLL